VLKVGRQISEILEVHLGMKRSEARKRSIELLEMVGIPGAEKRIDSYPHQFSGGMRQRVLIAMALACGPKLVLADEVTTALDVTIQAQVLDVLKDLASSLDMAMIFITHDLGIVAGMTQRVNVMYAGRIVEQASTRSLFANPGMPYTWGLLRAIPRLDHARRDSLSPIEGLPPDLASPPAGCRFAPRCQYRRDICAAEEPKLLPLFPAQRDHQSRCWGMQDVDGGGWLRGVDWRTDMGNLRVLEQIRREAAIVPAGAVDETHEMAATPGQAL
jgi:oligopeptide transport system ATP-binding protein